MSMKLFRHWTNVSYYSLLLYAVECVSVFSISDISIKSQMMTDSPNKEKVTNSELRNSWNDS